MFDEINEMLHLNDKHKMKYQVLNMQANYKSWHIICEYVSNMRSIIFK